MLRLVLIGGHAAVLAVGSRPDYVRPAMRSNNLYELLEKGVCTNSRHGVSQPAVKSIVNIERVYLSPLIRSGGEPGEGRFGVTDQ